MQIYCPGYAAWKFTPHGLQERLAASEDGLERAAARGLYVKGNTLLALTGTSGVWLAALLAGRGHRVILVRKPSDSSHGAPVEGEDRAYSAERPRAVLLDDFISSGKTVRNVAQTLWRAGDIPLVAVVCHDRGMSYGNDEIRVKAGDYIETIPVFAPRP